MTKKEVRALAPAKPLCEKFFLEIRNWYYWVTETGVPGKAGVPAKLYDSETALRHIVRLLFCFFLKEKGLIPKELFDERFVKEHFKENEEYRYYNAVLRNVFFHCLNTPIKERKEIEYKQLIKNVHSVKDKFDAIPFLNGGIFTEHEGDEIALNDDYFFSEEQTQYLSELGGNYKVAGIITILSQYQYRLTLDDLLDREKCVEAVDPEFIGKVFESLLACIDADSKETLRKVSGSYYTPREIVDYMVNEACDSTNRSLNDIKILDPACGSGAFPCGIVNEIMRRLDPHHELPQSKQYSQKLEIIRKIIYGVDIQPIAVQITQLRLFLMLMQDVIPDRRKDNYGIKPLPNLETNFVCADILHELPKDLFGIEKFDIVIGNPPYVEAKKLKKIALNLKHYEVHSGTADLSVYFLERGLDLLKENGLLILIMTNKFFNTEYGRPVRKKILTHQIRSIINFEQVCI
ncbi:MAG: N-6 DNA methylase, partial [Planctomycetaceae bacterium]|nr:N-6 DNA methylase [Planctomycetaceae bacterium]